MLLSPETRLMISSRRALYFSFCTVGLGFGELSPSVDAEETKVKGIPGEAETLRLWVVFGIPTRPDCPKPGRLVPGSPAEPKLNVGRGVAEALRAVVVPSLKVKGLGELPKMEDPPKGVELVDSLVLPDGDEPVFTEAPNEPGVPGAIEVLLKLDGAGVEVLAWSRLSVFPKNCGVERACKAATAGVLEPAI